MAQIQQILLLFITSGLIYHTVHSKEYWEWNQLLKRDKLQPCTQSNNNMTQCQDKTNIPQPGKTGSLNNILQAKMPGGYEIKTNGSTMLIIDLVFQKLEEMSSKKGIIKFNGFPRFWWVDKRLAWTPSQYDGINETHQMSDQVWVPDVIMVLASGETLSQNWVRWKDIVWVRSDGLCRWSPKGSFEIDINFNMKDQPFDTQDATIIMESWMQTKEQLILDVRFKKVDDLNIRKSTGWKYVSSVVKSESCTGQHSVSCFPSLSFTIKLQRMQSHNVKLLLVPTCLMLIIACLIVMHPERFKIKITWMLLYMIFVTFTNVYASSIVPVSDEVTTFQNFFNIMQQASFTFTVMVIIFGILDIKQLYDTRVPDGLQLQTKYFASWYQKSLRNTHFPNKNNWFFTSMLSPWQWIIIPILGAFPGFILLPIWYVLSHKKEKVRRASIRNDNLTPNENLEEYYGLRFKHLNTLFRIYIAFAGIVLMIVTFITMFNLLNLDTTK